MQDDEILNVMEETEAESTDADADRSVMACSRLNIGIFFDGTYNCRNVAGQEGYNDPSNVDLLEVDYKDEILQINGCNIKCGHDYVFGVAIDEDGTKHPWDGADGAGATGVKARANDGMEQVVTLIEELSENQSQIEILIDVFGFSRGSAAARHFANRVKDGDLDDYDNVRVRFLGLFDTVGSVGIPGNRFEPGVDLGTNGVADQIIHIYAENEYRQFFPSTLAKGGMNIPMVGDHSDVGGGHRRHRVSGIYSSRDHAENGIADLKDMIEKEWLDETAGETLDYIELDTMVPDNYELIYNWNAEHGLSDVSKAVMYEKARMAGVPFQDKNYSGELPSDLHLLYEAMMSGTKLSEGVKKPIRQKYAHFAQQGGLKNVANAIENDWERDFHSK